MNRLAGAQDVLLVVELSDSSLALDRRKANIYAEAGYATYWLIDMAHRRVEIRTQPQSGSYLKTEIVDDSGELTPPNASRSIRIADILPR